MDNLTLVKTALEYYDKNSETYQNTFKNVSYIKFVEAQTDIDHNILLFFDKNKKEIFRSRYEIMGLYDSISNTWAWSWAISNFHKKNTNIARKIWNYGATLDPKTKYLKTELITSRFKVASSVQLEIHVSIASYLAKQPFIYRHYVDLSSVENESKNSYNEVFDEEYYENHENYVFYNIFLLDHENIKI
jgi:hypothetical protein